MPGRAENWAGRSKNKFAISDFQLSIEAGNNSSKIGTWQSTIGN
jgi:hypothetical protein